jgi:polar amino acid transport system substrate-binding protein
MIKKLSAVVSVLFILCGTAAQASEITVFANESMPQSGMVDGKATGMAVDILNAVTAEGGPTFKFDFSQPWARAQAAVHETAGSAIIPLTRTPEREPNYKWIANLFDNPNRLFSAGRPAPIKTLDEAKGMSVGVMRGSSVEQVLKQLGFTHIEVVANDELAAKMLAAEHIDAWAGAESVQRYLFSKAGGDSTKLQPGPLLGEPPQIYIAGDTKFPDADAKAIADGVEKLRSSGKLAAILKKYQ